MRKVLLSLLLLLTFTIPAVAGQDWTDAAAKLRKSIVLIQSEEGTCTGFVIDSVRKYVQSAAHCDTEKNKLWVDLVRGNIVSLDTQRDLAVYEVKDLDPKRPALTLAAKDPEVGDRVLSFGFGMALEEPMARDAMVSSVKLRIPELFGDFTAIDAPFVGGQSGGPVVNREGEVVMIVQRASGTTGIGVPASVIRERMGRFWAK